MMDNSKVLFWVASGMFAIIMALSGWGFTTTLNNVKDALEAVNHRIDRAQDRIDCINMRLDYLEAGKTTRCNGP